MNNLYHKIAVASVSIALAFTLEVNKEVKAATFTLTSPDNFYMYDKNKDYIADGGNSLNLPLFVGITRDRRDNGTYYETEYRAFYQFNIANFSVPSNTVITTAILQTRVLEVDWYGPYFKLAAYGINEPFDVYNPVIFNAFDAGTYLDGENLGYILRTEPAGVANFNVFPFINQRIKNNETFAMFGLRNLQSDHYGDDDGYITLDRNARLIITTEPVPEPTTIFGSALALGVGRWLKRKKSSQQNKTTP